MTRWRRLLFLVAVLTMAPVSAVAQPAGGAVSAEDQRKAQEHFHKARELYGAGNYREAIHELEVARGLDPKAKDLVMNLAIVNEKAGKYDEALAWFKTYLEMDGITAAERSKAEANMKRIEGAKREHAARTPSPPASGTPAPPPSATASGAEPARTDPPKGRVDGATIAAGAIAGVGLAAGATFGILALTQRPNGFVTGRDGTFADLQSKTDGAHTMAIVADVALGVGVVATIATLYLYFGRTKEPAKSGFVGGFRF
ncbi:MAG: tetratricopeptide repeat protein [Labilithrix sp.]|nr:tetratricopeptide repeat protein [Labilithrix sp.]MCW5814471.1 tetratricopeptide repeat protein [Labilithrix sp.]